MTLSICVGLLTSGAEVKLIANHIQTCFQPLDLIRGDIVNKALISVLGNDQPGIMAAVATVITEHGGNIENLSQTLLQSVFGALLMVSMSEDAQCKELQQALQQIGQKMRLSIHVDPWDEQPTQIGRAHV